MIKKRFFVITFIAYVLNIASGFCNTDFYAECLPAFTVQNGETFRLATVNNKCRDICEKECQSFSRKFDPYKIIGSSNDYVGLYEQELNEDVIIDCYSSCQKGDLYKYNNGAVEVLQDEDLGGPLKYKNRYYEAFQETCGDGGNEDYFYSICVDDKGAPASGCSQSRCDSPSMGFVRFYKVLQPEVSVGMVCPVKYDAQKEYILESDQTIIGAIKYDDFSSRAYETKQQVKEGDQFNVSMIGGQAQNQLALCGKKFISLDPIFTQNIEYNQLDNWFVPPKSQDSNRYLASLNADDYEKFKNNPKYHWNSEILKKRDLALGIAGWGARNASYFDTGIYLQDGDYLSLNWKGTYSFKYPLQFNSTNYTSNRQNLLFKCLWDDAVSKSTKKLCKDVWNLNSHLLIKDPSDSNDPYISSKTTPPKSFDLFGEEFRLGGVDYFGLTVPTDKYTSEVQNDGSKDNTKYGLAGRVTDFDMNKVYYNSSKVKYGKDKIINCYCNLDDSENKDNDGCNNRQNNYHCIDKNSTQTGVASYSVAGTLNDSPFAKTRSRLYIKHKDGFSSDVNTMLNYYKDNGGGYSLNIDWHGCPKNQGNNIQYIVAEAGSFPDNETSWVDVPQGVITEGKNLIIDSKAIVGGCRNCKLFFRIKLEDAPTSGDEALKAQFKYFNTHGQYYLNISKVSSDSDLTCSGTDVLFYQTMKDFRNILLGERDASGNVQYDSDDAKKLGATGVIFKNFFTPICKNVISIFIILAIIFYALSFMMGLSEMNTEEFLKICMKLALMFILISERSWEFFGGYLVPFFIDGAVELAALYAAEIMGFAGGGCKQEILEHPYKVFEIISMVVSQFFGSMAVDTWKKIWSIFTHGFAGIFAGGLIVLSIAMFCYASFQAMIMFMFAMMINSILILCAPIFMILWLFPMTRSLFDRYLKSLFSYMLQPVFVFAALLVLNFVVLQFIYTLFNFGVCSYCFMEIIIGPFYDECWIPGYESLVAMHSPDADGYSGSKYNLFTTFGNTLVLSLVFGTIAMSSPTFISSMAGLAAWIVTGSAMRHTNIGGAAAEVVGSGGIVVKQASRTKSRLSTWNKNRQAGNKKYDNQKTRKDLTKKNRALGFKDDSGSSNQDN